MSKVYWLVMVVDDRGSWVSLADASSCLNILRIGNTWKPFCKTYISPIPAYASVVFVCA